jgi:hypothetical protein
MMSNIAWAVFALGVLIGWIACASLLQIACWLGIVEFKEIKR